MKRWRAAAVAMTTLGLAGVPATAGASGSAAAQADGGAVAAQVATGLDGPRQLGDYRRGSLVVAESDTGEVSSVDRRTGAVTTLVSGLYGPQGVAYRDGELFIAVGGPPPPQEGGPQPAPGQASAALLVAHPDGTIVRTVDLLAYERANNPDGQVQEVNGAPVDSLSNPFAVLAQEDRVLVADAGANDVLSVDPGTGEISTFFVPPTVSPDDVPACAQAQANPGTVGCDPVPTGIAEGPDGLLYVSTLGALVPGAARVYVLTQDGDVVRRIDGLSDADGLAVDDDGTVYVSDLLHGAPQGPPPAGFDPATVGRIVRITSDDERTYASVPMPAGLDLRGGRLYASAWAVAAQFGATGAGQVVEVDEDAFTAAP